MGRKTAAEKDLATLKTLRPKLATELERVIKAGRNENKSAMKQSGTTAPSDVVISSQAPGPSYSVGYVPSSYGRRPWEARRES
jgi:hypothetical protein